MDEKDIFITFMRHGRSRADDEQVHEGRYDSLLLKWDASKRLTALDVGLAGAFPWGW